MKKLYVLILFLATSLGLQAQTHHAHSQEAKNLTKVQKTLAYQELNQSMRELWSAHMYWTLITVDAFFNDPNGLESKLGRLLQNQQDIGNAVIPFYGEEAGKQLAKLLTEHIEGAVPVLQAAQANDEKALDVAVKDWYRNANEIGEFLASANPKHWTAEETKAGLEMHISHTIDYAVNILKGDYKTAFESYEEALQHMLVLGDILSDGLSKQFPKHFVK